MKAILHPSQQLSIEVEGDNVKQVFEQLAVAQEVFGTEECGCCHEKNFRFMCRTDDDENKYYELHCQNLKCRAKLTYGCHKKGNGLFPKKHWGSLSDSDKKNRGMEEQPKGSLYLPNGGWFKWVPPTASQKEE